MQEVVRILKETVRSDCALEYQGDPWKLAVMARLSAQCTDARVNIVSRELFEKIYLYRPIPITIEGDVYTFDCSANQVLYYFERFGSEALILSPKKLGIFMRNYYYFALKKYRSIYGKD